jgi:hypothetical protein
MPKELPRVTAILRESGLSDFSKVNASVLIHAQEFGSAAHKACELDDLGILDMDKLSAPLLPYLEAWRKFRKDYNLSFVRDEIERHLVSTKWNFQGTPDRIARADNILVDIKTSTVIYPSVAIQCAAYTILAEENGMKIKKRFCVQLKEDGYSVTPYNEISDRTVFLSALNCYRFKQKHNLLEGKNA